MMSRPSILLTWFRLLYCLLLPISKTPLYLWVLATYLNNLGAIQERSQEPYKFHYCYLVDTCTSKIFLFKLGLLTFYLLFVLFLLVFVAVRESNFKKKGKWVQEVSKCEKRSYPSCFKKNLRARMSGKVVSQEESNSKQESRKSTLYFKNG